MHEGVTNSRVSQLVMYRNMQDLALAGREEKLRNVDRHFLYHCAAGKSLHCTELRYLQSADTPLRGNDAVVQPIMHGFDLPVPLPNMNLAGHFQNLMPCRN